MNAGWRQLSLYLALSLLGGCGWVWRDTPTTTTQAATPAQIRPALADGDSSATTVPDASVPPCPTGATGYRVRDLTHPLTARRYLLLTTDGLCRPGAASG